MKNPGILPGKIHVTYPPTMLPVITGTRYRTSLVWIVIAATVTKVVEVCVHLRRRYYAIFGMLPRRVRALRSPLSALLSVL